MGATTNNNSYLATNLYLLWRNVKAYRSNEPFMLLRSVEHLHFRVKCHLQGRPVI